jgi:hypothetical protein
MVPIAIKVNDTVYVIDPCQVRWMEYHDRYKDLTIYYQNGNKETIRHRNIRKVYNDLLLSLNVLDVNSSDYIMPTHTRFMD